ncbi:unnamed protein product [Bursaphelenchus xylophilus]|uniref:(pine wood nematode) hypothetical protein n=1 Tax=Bursaphelenchus xylophilus TaxID=6326 RepID=A0A1I7S1U8_BURXY|nr:unnamed protein product [Bursaphelenchus xylophilus]CAG9089967.1 unnamed protein product [Bursaphelenchus xylophilus]
MFTSSWHYFPRHGERLGVIVKGCTQVTCQVYWDSRPEWEDTVAVMLWIAFLIGIVLLTWTVVAYSCLFTPGFFVGTTILSALATICLLIGVSLFGAKNGSETVTHADNTDWLTSVGFSFWFAITATALFFGTTILSLTAAVVFYSMKLYR